MNNLRRRTSIQTGAAVPFIITVETTSANETFTLPLVSSGTYNFEADWGDLQTDQITAFDQPEVTHTYATAGTYDITMTGVIVGWSFGFNNTSRLLITDIKQFGGETGVIFDVNSDCFSGCTNLDVSATDLPNLQGNSMQNFFLNCSSLVGNSSFNSWDTSNVTNMVQVFRGCTNFNQDIGGWDVSSVESMASMFRDASAFNNGGSASINNWVTTSLTNISVMFRSADSFNQPIGNWNVSSVTDFSNAFRNTSFNQDISSWNTQNATNFERMFAQASAFDQDLGSWNISNLSSADGMFNNATLSTANYDSLLIGWEAQDPNIQSNVDFDGGNSTYSLGGAAETARNNLINNFSWNITDGGGISEEAIPISQSGSFRYQSGSVDENEQIYLTPSSSNEILKFDQTKTRNADTYFGSSLSQYTGAVLSANGFIYFVPLTATAIAKINTTNDVVSTFGSLGGGQKYAGGVLAPNGKIYCAPFDRDSFLVIDPTNDTFTEVSLGAVSNDAYIGAVLAENGFIYCIPYDEQRVLKIDPSNDSFSFFGSISGGDKYAGGVLAQNGNIYFVNNQATDVIKLDPSTDTLTVIDTITSGDEYDGGQLMPDGKIYCAARSANTLLEIDTNNDTASKVSYNHTNSSNAYIGMHATKDGNLLMSACSADNFYKFYQYQTMPSDAFTIPSNLSADLATSNYNKYNNKY